MGRKDEIKKQVRAGYAKIALTGGSCCGACAAPAEDVSRKIGYSDKELRSAPQGANLGLGCGNPVALASLKKGETVLDLGSGAGFDCFLAANRVGKKGRVIGVDMTPEMLHKARENAEKCDYGNVEFRLGEIENIPAADNSVDVVISNCVINLAPDKGRVFREAFRVLKPSGRLMVSDIVLLKELPAAVKSSIKAYVGCLAGAIMRDKYLKSMENAGFRDIKIISEAHYPIEFVADGPAAKIIDDLKIPVKLMRELADSIVSIKVQGKKEK